MREISPHQLDFGAIVRTGERVAWTSGTGEPLSLSERLVEQRHAIGKFRLFLGTMYSNTLLPEHCDTIEVLGLGAVGTARRLAAAGAMNMLPVHMSELGDAIRSKRIDIDVALIQVAEDPDTGELSYGAVNFYTHDLVQAARVVVAEINETAPYTFSSQSVPKERIALAVRSRRPILEISEQAVDEVVLVRDVVVERHRLVAGEMEQRVEQHRAVTGREHEAVAVGPSGIACVEFQEAREQYCRHVRHTHRHPRMSRLRLLDGVDGKKPNSVGHFGVADFSTFERARKYIHIVRLFRSINCRINGVRMSCIARSSLAPWITIELARDMKLCGIIDSR